MSIKLKDLQLGMKISFSKLDKVKTYIWDVKVGIPYKITQFYNGEIVLDLLNEKGEEFYVLENELEDAYIVFETSNALTAINPIPLNSYHTKTKDKTIGVLEVLSKYYDSIPSELIKELVKINMTELHIK